MGKKSSNTEWTSEPLQPLSENIESSETTFVVLDDRRPHMQIIFYYDLNIKMQYTFIPKEQYDLGLHALSSGVQNY